MNKRTENIRVGIVGAGLMGHRRAEAIKTTRGSRLIAVADIDIVKAKQLSEAYECDAENNWQSLIKRSDIDVVIIAVPHSFLVPIAVAAIKHAKHIFCEKPLGRNVAEAKKIVQVGKKHGRAVKVGFNHRFHAAISQAKRIFDEGGIGKLLFIRARYGYGGRLGMEKEWRFNKKISGGGELLDQGSHIVDLCRYFGGEFRKVYGIAESMFWKPGIDDNDFVILKGKNAVAEFHVSATQWKNLFSFEVFGDTGFLVAEGKGGSYGKETLVYGKRKKEFGAPETQTFEFDRDVSWEEEWKNFMSALRGKEKFIGTGEDGLEANRIIEAIYKSSEKGKPAAI